MTQVTKLAAVLLFSAAAVAAADKPFPVISKVDATTIAGRPVQLDGGGKLLSHEEILADIDERRGASR